MKKSFLLFIISVVVGLGISAQNRSNNNEYYYFLTSRTIHKEGVKSMNYFLYTDIIKFIGPKDELDLFINKWREIIDQNCEASKLCTADLNIYNSEAEAQSAFTNHLRIFQAKADHKLIKMDFKPN